MYLRSIQFRDWKAYKNVTLDFPQPEPGKNVVLIGAKNGFGKTTLLEGIVLGLFGRDGLSLVGRATFQDAGADRLDVSYNDFLERAFHAQARDQGRSSASVKLVFEGDAEERITVHRIWHFSGSGKHRREDEEVRIWVGPDDEPLPISKLDDKDEVIRSFIAKNFLPVHLAQFFLFDGEQVQRLAKRDMATQVRLGIEGILGVPILRELAEDLREYARDRRKKVANVGDEAIDRLRAEIRELEANEEAILGELKQIVPQLEPLQTRRDQLVKEYTSLPGGNYANLKELFEGKEKITRKLDQYKEEFRKLLSFDVALALAGPELREATKAQLAAETVREQWELGKRQGEERFDSFINSLDSTAPELKPELTARQKELLTERLRNAWQNLWYPPPEEAAQEARHGYLKEADRLLVAARLDRASSLEINHLGELLRQIGEFDQEIKKLDSRVALQKGVETQAEKLASDLNEVNVRIAKLESRKSELDRAYEGLKGQLAPKRQEMGGLEQKYHVAEPQLRRAALADKVSTMIESIMEEAFPSQIDDVARAMTEAYRAMAHKDVVKKIEIEADCSVKLCGSRGRNLRELDPSAGESQVFALSLIAAIAQVSKCGFPIVMDTPLARLDSDHRKNVLNYFTGTDNQVILLSHPDEVTGPYLELIRPKLLKALHINHEEISDGVGSSEVVEGYFEGALVAHGA